MIVIKKNVYTSLVVPKVGFWNNTHQVCWWLQNWKAQVIIWWVLEPENPKILNIMAKIRKDYRMRYDNNDITKACSFLHSPQLKYQRSLLWNYSLSNVKILFDADRIILLVVMQDQKIFRNMVYVRNRRNELSYQEFW